MWRSAALLVLLGVSPAPAVHGSRREPPAPQRPPAVSAGDAPAGAAAAALEMIGELKQRCHAVKPATGEKKWDELFPRAANLSRRLRMGYKPDAFARHLGSAVSKRCTLFKDKARWKHKSLIFTHIPKTGGQSMEIALRRNAAAQKVQLVAGHNRIGDLRESYPKLFRTGDEADLLTVFREPSALLLSDFHYIQRHPDHGDHYRLKDMTLREHLEKDFDDGVGDGLGLFTQTGRKDKILERLRGLCTSARIRSKPYRCLCSELYGLFFQKTLELLAARYAVVGVLERLPETLEVARCRVPWLKNFSDVPHHNRRPSHSKKEDAHDTRLMKEKTFMVSAVYKAVNRMLDADLQCCRARRSRA
eukprot:TRINITY_DN16471_c0_g1_i1.p1 TRINITY_DN16471_c0_g1~~TRINITY_DN16471_c0_g1_i1.p1  ORF type:complete len:386 (+),score=102.75 TRINITY_DN16471_c0_g1_i1:76-1158(+)